MRTSRSPPSGGVVASTTNGTRGNRQGLHRSRSRNVSAPCLSSMSFRLPHFGLCTHDGAAVVAGAASEQPCGVPDPALELLEAALGDPDAARVAVVDEDGRPPGLRVEVRREPADVPAVAHRPERQQRDQRVLGGVQRAEQLRHLVEPGELVRLGQEPDRLGRERRRRAGRARRARSAPGRRSSCARSRRPARSPRSRRTRARGRAAARPGAARRSGVIVSRFACVYQSPANGSTTACSVVRSSSRTRNDSPRWR